MSFKQATKQKLRFDTSRGSLSIEQLWDLPLTELDQLAVSLEAAKENGQVKSFLATKSEEDKTAQLKFDVAYEILKDRIDEADAARQAAQNKEHNQKILALIQKKKDDKLENLSVEELEAELK